MAASIELEKPYALLKLPQPIDTVNGRYHMSNVWHLPLGSKKRKRSELVVAIDGEGLNIYSVCARRLQRVAFSSHTY
jgi:hypothetical protein